MSEYRCLDCGSVFVFRNHIDVEEERYNNSYEPLPVTCFDCDSDKTQPHLDFPRGQPCVLPSEEH